VCISHNRACCMYSRELWHTHTCQNHTLRVCITLLRVEITVVSVVIIFVRVKVTMRVQITLCMYKSHSACINHTRKCHNHTHAWQNPTLRVKITLKRIEITVLSGKITLIRDKITLCVYESPLCVFKSHSCVSKSQCVWKLHSNVSLSHTWVPYLHAYNQNYSRVCGNHTLCVKSHFAGDNCTVRLEIPLMCVEITLVRVVIVDPFLF
jgi:hypothetical protein